MRHPQVGPSNGIQLTGHSPQHTHKDRLVWCGPSNGIQLERQHSPQHKHKDRLVWCGHWGVYNSTQARPGRMATTRAILP